MKVIDFHVHVGLKEHWHSWVKEFQKSVGSDYYERYDELSTPHGFADYVKQSGIEKAVILAEYSPVTTGVVTNDYVLEFCKGMDCFIPFASVNHFLTPDPAGELRSLFERGCKGVKLYPSYHYFYPNDREVYPIYGVAAEHGFPVMVHTGSSIFRGSRLKYADPIHLDDVARDFPGLKILLVHGGRGIWYDTAFLLSRMHENVYLEVSGLPPQNLLKYFPDMEKNSGKIVYGSDWPGVVTIGENIEKMKRLPLSGEALESILYGNARGILGL